jgi:hypothetical protein
VLAQIAIAKPEKLYVIADGPRVGNSLDSDLVTKTRGLFDELNWDCELVKIYSDSNMGLRNRVISGLDQVFESESRAIILEDDCLPSISFFKFSEEMLARYEDTPSVFLVSGNNFAPRTKSEHSYYFSSHANIWGWATWSRSWQEFRKSTKFGGWSADEISQMSYRIPGAVQRRSFINLVKIVEKLDSWAVAFAAFGYLNKKLSVVPFQNLVTNVGFGLDSTHTKFESYVDEIPLGTIEFPLVHPGEVSPSNSEMLRESRIKSSRWLSYAFMHPVDVFGRVFRYAKYLSRREQ